MTNSYDVDHGLSQCPPGPLEPVELPQQDDTLARTGNTARDQEMYAAGIRTGEENAKHNAAIRGGLPDGWKLLAKKTCYMLMHDGDVIATLAGPESKENAAIIASMLAAPASPVSTVEQGNTAPQADVLEIARETGLRSFLHGVNAMEARTILQRFVDALPAPPVPAAGDARDKPRFMEGDKATFWSEHGGGADCVIDRAESRWRDGKPYHFARVRFADGAKSVVPQSSLQPRFAAQRQGDA